MEVLSQHNIAHSLNQALIPESVLIDARTEKDRLNFLVEYSSLINFYNQQNKVQGNWTPFLLKDPVFLLASISSTDYDKAHKLFISTCSNIRQLLNLTEFTIDLPRLLNQLFDQLTRVFMQIEQWTSYMLKSNDEYDLKQYSLQHVKTTFSPYFWAIQSLREYLFTSSAVEKINPVKYYQFEGFDNLLWIQNKDNSPFWKILHIKELFLKKENYSKEEWEAKEKKNIRTCVDAITNVGDELFNFYTIVVQSSPAEYEKVKTKRSKFPDTTLLRTFVSLLQVHQEQLNGISQKHLDFYYKDVLKQYQLYARPDYAFVCAQLASKDSAFYLPKNTLFNAGLDVQKNTILFQNTESATINPGYIDDAYTLTVLPTDNQKFSLYKEHIDDPGKLMVDEDGKIKQWHTFGDSTPKKENITKLGISFASPLLLLKEGHRKIELIFEFSQTETEDVFPDLFTGATYYLSTKEKWVNITKKIKNKFEKPYFVTMEIDLETDFLPIEPFAIHPDGNTVLWPELKIEFSEFSDLKNPPLLQTLYIGVNVSGIKTLQLYNDYGSLSTKAPFQLFGPLPAKNSNFIIGSNEIFSKPLVILAIKIDWDNLPENPPNNADAFATYYNEYNQYIIAPTPPFPPTTPPKAEKKSIWKRILSFFKKKKPVEPKKETDPPPPYFDNSCFTIYFNWLINSKWIPFKVLAGFDMTLHEVNKMPVPVEKKSNGKSTNLEYTDLLFRFDSSFTKLESSSLFVYISENPQNNPLKDANPYIQLEELVYTDSSTTGFMRMVLSNPGYGFGAEIYAQVVSYIALINAKNISANPSGAVPYPTPNAPFAPAVKELSAQYAAAISYTFDYAKGGYPIQCHLYSPFANYLAYDSTQNAENYISHVFTPISGVKKAVSALPLYPFLDYEGVLFLGLKDLVPTDSINFYAELARKYGVTPSEKTIDYFSFCKNGWEKLDVLSDTTKNLSCSGIVQVNIKSDITKNSFMMPNDKYWLSLAIKKDATSVSDTYFLTTNGFLTQRTGDNFLLDKEAPQLASGAISATLNALPEIALLTQPFPSFDGKGAETSTQMNQRVSNRIKTKDRAVTTEDYFGLIQQEFSEIYYSKTDFNQATNTIRVYLVNSYKSWTDPNAFTPLATECSELKVKDFLLKRCSPFAKISVSNFEFVYTQVTATIKIKTGYQHDAIKKDVGHRLNIYLSPWIKTEQTQLSIDQGINSPQVAEFIKTIDGVHRVLDIELKSYRKDGTKKVYIEYDGLSINSLLPNELIVPYTYHVIHIDSKHE